MKSRYGFTLIELLVVIAVIGILAAVVLAALNDARVKARDTKRLADIRSLQTALEMYYADNGRYPQSSWISSYQGTWQTGTLGTALAPYMPTLPVDPTNSATGAAYGANNFTYSYFASGNAGSTTTQQWYMLVALPEKTFPQRSVRACDSSNYAYSGRIMAGGNCTQ